MKNTGIWIDTREAIIIHVENEKTIRTEHILSGAERKPKVAGEKSKRTVRGGIGFDYETSQKNKFKEDLKKYFAHVTETVADADQLYILGPAEAKLELEKEINRNPELSSKVLKVESCDSLTTNQIIEKVRTYFTERSRTR